MATLRGAAAPSVPALRRLARESAARA